MNIKALLLPFDVKKISWRLGSTNAKKMAPNPATKGIPLAYIDARDVMERLDEVCGPENWQCRYPFAGCCDIGIKINNEWVWKSNGAGETDVEAEKGQYSDAFKRAAVLWGVGRYLYDLPNTWIDLEDGKLSKKVLEDLSLRLHKWQVAKFKNITGSGAGATLPNDGIWESMSDDMQIYLKELAGEIKGDLEADNVQYALERIEMARLSIEAEIALDTLFDSKQRAMMKAGNRK